ncbi:MAG: hypothetical protein MUF10_10110 [Thermoanaerobaculaceae bacterium]|nr:hypothetical protein [Thermoanaerobaculaceae bacterium]
MCTQHERFFKLTKARSEKGCITFGVGVRLQVESQGHDPYMIGFTHPLGHLA